MLEHVEPELLVRRTEDAELGENGASEVDAAETTRSNKVVVSHR
jgi:hypothetical protein